MRYTTRRLGADDLAAMKTSLQLYADVFADHESYQSKIPRDDYLLKLLGDETFFAVATFDGDGEIVGALAAYELRKFEQERSEVYIYDLAVDMDHRRKGIATALIRSLGKAARARGAYVMFVQADIGEEDEAANALYRKLSHEMIVAHHYDIAP
jgi:aminoglycoside 3-N-acetyltransferase I